MARFNVSLLAALLLVGTLAPAGAHATTATEHARHAALLERQAASAVPRARAVLLQQAAQLWNAAGDRMRARATLGNAIEMRPTDPTLWLRRAELHAAIGDFWAAIDDATQAIDIDPARLAAFALRASLWRRIDVRDMAIADLERALEIDPDSTGLRAQLARLQPGAPPPRTALSVTALDLQIVQPSGGAPPRPSTSDLAALDNVTTRAVRLRQPRSLLPAPVLEAAAARPIRPLPAPDALDALTLAAALPPRPRSLIPDLPKAPPSPPAAALDDGLVAAGRSRAPAVPRPLVSQQVVALLVSPRDEMASAMAARLAAIAPAAPPPPPEPAAPMRISNAPPPRIFRGSQIPTDLAMRAGLPHEAPTRAGIGGPFSPVGAAAPQFKPSHARATPRHAVPARRRAAPARQMSFDATPVDPMREQLVPAPTLVVTRETLP